MPNIHSHGSWRSSGTLLATLALAGALAGCGADAAPTGVQAKSKEIAPGFPDFQTFREAAITARNDANGGLNLDMWATIVDRTGTVLAIVFTGEVPGDQWPGSRVISAQKANTANAFSLNSLALSTANLYTAVQPGGTLFGLQESNPVNDEIAYKGDADDWGSPKDFLIGKRIGGVNVFGGGLALYNAQGEIIGGLGLSGDTSCADHNIAWKVRDILGLDFVPAGVSPTGDDNIIYDFANGTSPSGFGHPQCSPEATAIGQALPQTHPIGGGPQL